MKLKNNSKLANEWFKIGEEEFKFAQASFDEFNAFYPQICFQCQQAVEKCLKGFLVFHKKKFPKIHDLTQLAKLCGKLDKEFLKFLDKFSILSQYYLVARYPIEYPPAGKIQAKEALEIAREIIKFVKGKLKDKNPK